MRISFNFSSLLNAGYSPEELNCGLRPVGHSTDQLPDPPQQVDHLGPELGVEPEVDERVCRRVIVLVWSGVCYHLLPIQTQDLASMVGIPVIKMSPSHYLLTE